MKKKMLAMPIAMMMAVTIGAVSVAATSIQVTTTPAQDLMENQPAAMPTDDTVIDGAMMVTPEGEMEAMATMPEAIFTKTYGTITELPEDFEKQAIRVQDEMESLVDFMFSEDTIVFDQEGNVLSYDDLQAGDTVSVSYIMPAMMTMIYPAQMPTAVVTKIDQDVFGLVDVNVFDDEGMALDFSLKLNLVGDEIVNLDGSAYEGSIDGKIVAVFYGMTTRSLPPQTTPTKVVVIDDYEMPEYPTMMISEDESTTVQVYDDVSIEAIGELPIIVNGEIVEDAKAYYNGSATMVPLRAIVETSGSTVGWDAELGQAVVGAAIYVTPGENSYSAGRAMPTPLECAPEILEGVTYVPVSFFTDIVFGEYRVGQGAHDFTISAE